MDCAAPPRGGWGDAIHKCPLDAVAYDLLFMLTCAVLMTSSQSKAVLAAHR